MGIIVWTALAAAMEYSLFHFGIYGRNQTVKLKYNFLMESLAVVWLRSIVIAIVRAII